MQTFDIDEPRKNCSHSQDIAVGIDFGTTNSLIAYSKHNDPKVITSIGKKGLLPSIIFYDKKTGHFTIGKKKKKSLYSIKRFFSKSYKEIKSIEILRNKLIDFNLINDTSSLPQIILGKKKYTFPELASKIFLLLKQHTEQELGIPIKKAVVSVPAYFDGASRGAIMLAAQIAGFDILRIIAEPTAAACAYGFHKKSKGAYMVYDFGGGTFDVSILNIQEGVLQVIATGGDNMLGGDDLDHILARYISRKLNLKLEQKIYLHAKRIKEILSLKNTAFLNLGKKNLELKREVFEKLIAKIIRQTIKIAKDTLFDANVILDGIILVGGSTRIPLISKTLSDSFGVKLFSDIDPDKIVVLGAAIQAENLSSYSDHKSLLIDVLPLSLGIELYGGITEKIIMRNTPIPFSVKKTFTTYADYQNGIQFHILQGEREMAKDCRSLGKFELKNIPSMKAGTIKIEVTFSIDVNGILSVTARENISGIAQNIELKPTYGLNEEKINSILEDGFKNNEKDYKKKLLVESIINAQDTIKVAIKVIDTDLVKNNKKKKILALISSLQKRLSSNDRDKILENIKELNSLTSNLLKKNLNTQVKSLLKNKHVDSNL